MGNVQQGRFLLHKNVKLGHILKIRYVLIFSFLLLFLTNCNKIKSIKQKENKKNKKIDKKM